MHDALVYYDDQTTLETRKFVIMFDRFFDCLNVRSPSEWYTHKKPDRKPYCEVDDPRFEVHLLIIISVKSDTDI